MEMGDTDVLVCGRCYSTFHFVQQFNEHKTAMIPCVKPKNDISDGNIENPKIWAFVLWKSAQSVGADDETDNLASEMEVDRAWPTYRKWLKLDETVRETWVVASRTIQSFAKFATGILEEMPVKITKTVVDLPKTGATAATGAAPIKPNATKAMSTPKPAAAAKLTTPPPSTVSKPVLTPIAVKKSIAKPAAAAATPSSAANKIVAPTITDNTSRWAQRTIPNTDGQTEDLNVEKIMAKRFNPRIKQHEYLIKWEKRSPDENGWEPKSHLETCPDLLLLFEAQLARQKEIRAKAEAAAAAAKLKTDAPAMTAMKRKATNDSFDGGDDLNESAGSGTKLMKTSTGATTPNGPVAKNNGASPTTTTGIVKKQIAGGPLSVQKGPAQVTFVPKAAVAGGLSGVVRVNSAGGQQVATTNKVGTANGPAAVAASKVGVKMATTPAGKTTALVKPGTKPVVAGKPVGTAVHVSVIAIF